MRIGLLLIWLCLKNQLLGIKTQRTGASMLLYRLRDRVLYFKDGTAPVFPAEVEVCAALAPEVSFGGVSGVSRNVVRAGGFKATANTSIGKFVMERDTPLFEPVVASITVGDTVFKVERNVVSVRSQCKSAQDLTNLLGALNYAFPAVLNVYFLDAPYPAYAWGQVGGAKFNWTYAPTEVIGSTFVTSKEGQEGLITDAWHYVAAVANSRRLMAGLYYFHVACRLLETGHNRFEFMAEALLNFAKSLQSLFGETRDSIREELEKLGAYDQNEIEGKFMPALFLRSEFDVAHVSLSFLSRGQLKILHDYSNIAEEAFRGLLKTVLEKVDAGEYALLPDTNLELSSDKDAFLEKLRSNIEPFCK